MDNRIVNPSINEAEEEVIEKSLRPQTFKDLIGRAKEKQNLSILVQAAQQRGDSLDHILLHGPPGLGKTSIAQVIANEAGVQFYMTSGPALSRKGDLASILTNIEKRGILFIDEIHRLNTAVEEVLYTAMEDNVIDIILGKGPGAKSVRLELNNITIIGATTKAGSLSSPLRDRFGLDLRLDYYKEEELMELIVQKANILNVEIDNNALKILASRARRTPRIAIRLLKRSRDYAQVNGKNIINKEIAMQCLEMLGIDSKGLDAVDRLILKVIIENFNGGPVGLQALSSAVSEDLITIEDVYEPFLLKEGLIIRTPRGRVVSEKALFYYRTLDGKI